MLLQANSMELPKPSAGAMQTIQVSHMYVDAKHLLMEAYRTLFL
jgi:hypothetical protein